MDFEASFTERHPYHADPIHLEGAAEQAALLSASGLDVLNHKVLVAPRDEVLDVIAEHNVAAMLIRRQFVDLEYEPTTMRRPVDFVGTHTGRRYRIEAKRLGANRHDALHGAVMATLNDALASRSEPVSIELHMQEAFATTDINALLAHVKKSLSQWQDGAWYFFPTRAECLASYSVHAVSGRQRPRVGAIGDVEMRDVTGNDEAQIISHVRSAYRKFKDAPADEAAHIVILEALNIVALSSVSNALYGKANYTFFGGGGGAPGRNRDGLFSRWPYSRLSAVLMARRERQDRFRLFAPYNLWLFRNPRASVQADEAMVALGVEHVYGPGDFPDC